MFSITNTKVAGFKPCWAGFRGFSVLFDGPGDCLTPRGSRLDLACNVDADLALLFYKGLRDGLDRLRPDLLTSTYGFCPLPSPSYHVTVWDGGNDGNIAKLVSAHRPELEDYLAGLPDAVTRPHEVTHLPLASPLVQRRDWDIVFEFDQLTMWGALVARLSPTAASRSAFDRLVAERNRLNADYLRVFGIRASEDYAPHVSLGYFANAEGAQLARPCLPAWNQVLSERMRGLTLSFPHASLYGFTDMATFFKDARAPRV